MIDRKNPWWMLGLVGVLVALLPVLALLQYRWIGAVSDGEQTRMQQTLNAGVMRFVEDINRPLERAHNTFLMGGVPATETLAAHLTPSSG